MGKKWQKIDPWEIKVGDRVKVKHDCGEYKETTYAHVAHTDGYEIGVGPYCFYSNKGTWYIRKPKKPKPLARPDEPPVGSFFRVDRTGREFCRYPQVSLTHYFHLACDAGDRPWVAWADVTEPGDTIQLLKLVAVDE